MRSDAAPPTVSGRRNPIVFFQVCGVGLIHNQVSQESEVGVWREGGVHREYQHRASHRWGACVGKEVCVHGYSLLRLWRIARWGACVVKEVCVHGCTMRRKGMVYCVYQHGVSEAGCACEERLLS